LDGPSADKAVARFGRNEAGRDFVVGDVHGMFEHLKRLLTDLDFREERDRLFSVGDLVDRGPHSRSALQWLSRPWFFACRGNHEQFAIDSRDPDQHDLWINYNGGEWWLELDEHERTRFRERFDALPLAMEVETASGRVGIVHADVPPFVTWERFMELLESGNRDAGLYAMWSRNRVAGAASARPVDGGVERIYCGHTPTRRTVRIGNVWYIDTGAAYMREGYEEARLTVVEIHPERHREYAIGTKNDL
jgi:serine/threonine protein phosphatase 1